jgi:hypothetical protein
MFTIYLKMEDCILRTKTHVDYNIYQSGTPSDTCKTFVRYVPDKCHKKIIHYIYNHVDVQNGCYYLDSTLTPFLSHYDFICRLHLDGCTK